MTRIDVALRATVVYLLCLALVALWAREPHTCTFHWSSNAPATYSDCIDNWQYHVEGRR